MKISEITAEDVAKYLRLETGDYDATEMAAIMAAAKSYIVHYTGIPATSAGTGADTDTLDNYPDFWLAYMVLCQDMYDNRTLTVENSNVNRVVESVLDMHRRNLV